MMTPSTESMLPERKFSTVLLNELLLFLKH
jgi:hypothetical protein